MLAPLVRSAGGALSPLLTQIEDEFVGALPLCGIIQPVVPILWYLQLLAGPGNLVRFFPFCIGQRPCFNTGVCL